MFISRFFNRRTESKISAEEARARAKAAAEALKQEKAANEARNSSDEAAKGFWAKLAGLPEPVFKKVLKCIGIALLVIAAGVIAAISFQEPVFCLIMVLAVFLLREAGNNVSDYMHGRIEEYILVCTEISKKFSSYMITMMDMSDDTPKAHVFFYPYSSECPFHVDCVYVIYTSRVEPEGSILAWKPM